MILGRAVLGTLKAVLGSIYSRASSEAGPTPILIRFTAEDLASPGITGDTVSSPGLTNETLTVPGIDDGLLVG